MTPFKRTLTIATAVLSTCVATGLLMHYARADEADHAGTAPAATAPAPDADKSGTASVTTAPLREGKLAQTLTAFGSVTTQPGAVEIFSVPYECQVSKIEIAAGQPLEKGTALVDVKPSPGAKLALAEAQSNLESAKKDLEQTQQRFNMKLGTNSDLLQSQQAVKLAQLRLDSLNQQGTGEDHRTLSTDNVGLVAKVDVQQGQIVSAGNPLIETIARDQVEVRLGVEPTLVASLTVGQLVELYPSNRTSDEAITGKIRLITQRVNPDTRLVDIFVTPDNRDALLLEGFVRGEIVTQTKTALIAPHDAVLSDDEGLLVYTIKDGHALKHLVTTGAHNDKEVAVISNDLHPGEPVVVQGNLELEPGMPVTIDGELK
jgi:membrane fusion protein (multidrug efflux system)